MFKVSNRDSQHIAAATMLPGIVLSMYWFMNTKHTQQYLACLSYIIVCLGSIMYHLRCSEDQEFTYHPKWFRLDISCQQLLNFALASSTPYGIGGGLVILPLIVLVICTDFADIDTYKFSMMSHASCFIISSWLLDKQICLQWLLSIYIFNYIDGYRKTLYGTLSQSIWHLMVHWNLNAVFRGCTNLYIKIK